MISKSSSMTTLAGVNWESSSSSAACCGSKRRSDDLRTSRSSMRCTDGAKAKVSGMRCGTAFFTKILFFLSTGANRSVAPPMDSEGPSTR